MGNQLLRLALFAVLMGLWMVMSARRSARHRLASQIVRARMAQKPTTRRELRDVAGVTPRAPHRHGLALPASRAVTQHRALNRVPRLERTRPLALRIDDPELASKELVEVDLATGTIVKRFDTPCDRDPSLAKWRDEAPHLLDASEVVDPRSQLQLVVDYPLERPVAFTIESSQDGFTRLELLARIGEVYEHVYEVEARTTRIPVGTQAKLQNRNRTDGTFGLSMHGLSDLRIEGVVIGSHAGERWVTLEMGS